ncbi:MAG: hypothetical protein ABIR84_12175, partial [Candidatus Nitrotoga sp.]
FATKHLALSASVRPNRDSGMRVRPKGTKRNQLSPKIGSEIAKLRSNSEKQKTDRITADPSLRQRIYRSDQ